MGIRYMIGKGFKKIRPCYYLMKEREVEAKRLVGKKTS